MKKSWNKEGIGKTLAAIVSITCFLLIWHAVTSLTALGNILPGPIATLEAFFRSFVQPIGRYTIWGHIFWSLSRVLVGFLAAAVCGIILGIAMSRYRLVEAIASPFYEMIRPIPPIAWISLAILWFGLGEPMKYFIIFIGAFNNITINVYMGGKSVDQELVGVARMLGANEKQVFTTVVIPATVPYIFAGLHIGLSISWATVVAAEMVRSSEGLGWIVVSGMDFNDIGQILVGIMAIGIMGFLLITAMRALEAKICEWNVRGV
ncbi:ABC transporter permease [Diplocloster hominis]|uniref:ABC transporter permease n=1 Tax=Diplocloster hominis TaxID=3079010 RepID=UPI0031BB23E1